MSIPFLYMTLSAPITASVIGAASVVGLLPATPGSLAPEPSIEVAEGTPVSPTLPARYTMPGDSLSALQCNGRLQQTRGNIWEGWDLYLKTTRERIGTVLQVARRHRFEDGTVREGVLVGFPDQTSMWIPRDAVHLLYLICRPNGAE